MIEILGKGAEGIVAKGIPILGKSIKLFKITDYNCVWNEELKNHLFVNRIDKNSVKIEDFNIIDIKDITRKEDLKIIKEFGFNDRIAQIIYNLQYEGIDLNNIFKTKKTLSDILKLSISLFESLKIYISNNFIHSDIALKNIIYLPKKNKLTFIDFSTFTNYCDIYDYNYNTKRYRYLTDICPPDFLIKYYKQKKSTFQTFFRRYKKTFSYQIMSYYFLNIDEQLLDLWNNNYTDPNRYDTFCLSINLLTVLRIYFFEYNTKIGDINYVENFFKQILFPSISINPTNRLSIDDIIIRIRNLKENLK